MPVTHVNRKGITFFLCHAPTARGGDRYFFARTPRGTPVDSVPPGYRLLESANGVVSLARIKPNGIPDSDVSLLRDLTAQYAGPTFAVFRLADHVAVYEDLRASYTPDSNEFGLRPLVLSPARARYSPVLRFRLVEPALRVYGSHDVPRYRWLA